MERLLSSAIVVSSLASFASAAADTLTVKTLSVALADKLAQSVSRPATPIVTTSPSPSSIALACRWSSNAWTTQPPHAGGQPDEGIYRTQNTSENVMKNAQANAGASHLSDIPGFLLLAGGMPVKSGKELLEAIGVGGNLDQQCAREALKKNKAP